MAFFALLPAPASAEPASIPEPIAPHLELQGTGLCAVTAESATPLSDFGSLDFPTYNQGMNAFIDKHKADRLEYVVRKLFDLSNNNTSGNQNSRGDFLDAVLPDCKSYGCDFVPDYFPNYALFNDPTKAFGVRARGFLNVTPELAGKPLHIAFYTDDAVSLTIWDKNANVYLPILHPGDPFAAAYRVSENITFEKAGVYPLEILYFEGSEHAALEMTYYVGMLAPQYGQVSLTVSNKDRGGILFTPESFFHTLSGEPSFPDLNQCQQCDRQFVNQAGNNGCVPGYYCNEAALCAPCDTAIFCGPTCSPCGGETPFCVNINGKDECGGCRDDYDCKAGFECDPIKHVCHECNDDDDCVKGDICVDHSCVPCANPDQCGGVSCNCCGVG
ncbi:MAG: hypothetical protein L6Q76_33520, partial [Polyangiaceae bacterium]|nr:hypothetical protein [Polyangiaceae bacterium]